MWINVSKDKLIESLSPLQDVVEKRMVNPNLSNILMEAKGKELIMKATNLQIGMITSTKADIREEGSLGINGKKLYEIVKSFSSDEVSIKTLTPTHCEVSDGKSPFKILYSSPEGFPEFPEPRFEIEGFPTKIIKEFIRKTFFSINVKDSRFVINGVLFKIEENKSIMVSTDGHRLSYTETEFNTSHKKEFLILKTVLQKLQRAEEETISIGEDERNIFFKFDGKIMNVSKVEGRFPNYQIVFPDEINYEIIVNKNALLESIKRASIIIDERVSGISFEVVAGKITVKSLNPDLGEFKEDLEADYNGEQFELIFNPRYLIEFLSVVDSDLVKFYMKEVGKAVVFEPLNEEIKHLYVVMPISKA